MRVMSFDGYIHNIGTGSLDVTGNPQLENGMKQRVFDGETWEEVGATTVKFETNDGHNHFHLMEVIDYQLWDEGRGEIIGPAQKVGFCLIDTELMEENFEAFYTIEDSNYCGVDSPESTYLNMGITPGWRDTYASNITFQWVDISNILPGRYWVTALTDPNNEILESNEDNNDIVFSINKFPIDGYNARKLDVQTPDEPVILKSITYGTVGDRAFVIADGPRNGSLDVPIGVDLLSDEIRYTPEPGFTGTDSFTYYAHDTSNGFPYSPLEVVVEIEVANSSDGPAVETLELGGEILLEDTPDLVLHQRSTIAVELVVDEASSPRWFGGNMPPGITVNPDTGEISGVPTLPGEFTSSLTAAVNGQTLTTQFALTVADAEVPQLQPANDFSINPTDRLAIYLGRGQRDSTYEGSGTPEGTAINSALPLIAGTPEEIGDFRIEVRELIDGEVVDTIEFTMTVRPAAKPAFPL